ncbi:rhomboid-like protein [Spirillospora sp. NPDC048911]|uniref:rhomboid-like protein n=1 Tax=Spirillospora sp. NPDC048911 TaxID=3364527 RepID=UPI0037248CE9
MGEFLRRYPVPLAFLSVFGLVWLVQAMLSPDASAGLVGWASTNLSNLSVNPIGTIVASAFVAEEAHAVLMVVLAIGIFPVARRFGNLRTMVLIAVAHVLGTVVSQGIAFVQLQLGHLSDSIRTMPDVGPSYVLSAALVATVLYGPGRWPRLLALAGWCALAPFLFEGLLVLDVAAVGHVVAMLAGAVVGALLFRRERRGAPRPPALAEV